MDLDRGRIVILIDGSMKKSAIASDDDFFPLEIQNGEVEKLLCFMARLLIF